MADLLVNLEKLPDVGREVERLQAAGVHIRRVAPYEGSVLRRFVETTFTEAWADEVGCCFAHLPPTCILAIEEGLVVGFAAYEVTRRGFFGPIGVAPSHRGRGIGRALMMAALAGLGELGYKYGVVGWAGPAEFYVKHAGAVPIAGSEYHPGPDWIVGRPE